MERDFDYYLDLIEKNQLPDDFDQWLMMDKDGTALAHVAASYSILPSDWTDKTEDWLIKNHRGIGETIAFYAISNDILPVNWTDKTEDWLEDFDGYRTLAHIAAKKGYLPPDWNGKKELLVKDSQGKSIGFYYYANLNKCDNNQTLEDYCQNMKDHLPSLIYERKLLINFLDPFLKSIQEQSQKEWMKTSDAYSVFLIDYVESIMDYIQDNLCFSDSIPYEEFEDLADKIKDKLNKTSQYIENEKVRIKEHLFKHYEDKNKSISKDEEDQPCFLGTF